MVHSIQKEQGENLAAAEAAFLSSYEVVNI
jgi:hypothetical protein